MVAEPNHPPGPESALAARILDIAHQRLVVHGYQALTMDELAHELGISKKTLYVHFRSKDQIVERIVDGIGDALRSQMGAVLDDPALTFTQKLRGVVAVAGTILTRVSPTLLRDLQRLAPHLYQKIEELRMRMIPAVFGRLIRAGMAEGKVRRDVDPAFATEFWLHAIRGLVQPAVLDRTGLTLPQTLARALDLYFAGLLTPAGRKDYEKHR